MSTENRNLSDEESFEIELFKAFKRFGYIFPDNIEAVKNFEKLYGTTAIEMPDHLSSFNKLIENNNPQKEISPTFRLAAFSSKNKNPLKYKEDSKKDKPA